MAGFSDLNDNHANDCLLLLASKNPRFVTMMKMIIHVC